MVVYMYSLIVWFMKPPITTTQISHHQIGANFEREIEYPFDSLSCLVDDHFAKSLGGATWNRIKEAIDLAPDGYATVAATSSCITNSSSSSSGGSDRDLHITSEDGSVDDHFAKALGATWFKIKAGSQQ